MNRSLLILGALLSVTVAGCEAADEHTSPGTIEEGHQALILAGPQGSVILRSLDQTTGIAQLQERIVVGKMPLTLTVQRASTSLPLTIYDGWYAPGIEYAWILLSPTQWNTFASSLPGVGGAISYSLTYDPGALGFQKGVAQFCYQGKCLVPASYPKDRTLDMTLLGTSCLGPGKAVVGSLSDDAGDDSLYCKTPWGT